MTATDATDYHRPKSLAEALDLRARHPAHVLLAGGTDLMVRATERPMPAGVIDLFGLDELRGIYEDGDDLVIGAGTTYAEILASSRVKERTPALAEAVRLIGALQIQARGTLGGNIGTSSPVGDTLPCLLAYDAVLELASRTGQRRIPYHEHPTGYRKTALRADELVLAVRFPPQPPRSRHVFRKAGTRLAQAISKVMVAAVTHLAKDGTFDHARFGLGAVADRPIRTLRAETYVLGKKPSHELAKEAVALVKEDVKPITDVRSDAAYRLTVACNVLERVIATHR